MILCSAFETLAFQGWLFNVPFTRFYGMLPPRWVILGAWKVGEEKEGACMLRGSEREASEFVDVISPEY